VVRWKRDSKGITRGLIVAVLSVALIPLTAEPASALGSPAKAKNELPNGNKLDAIESPDAPKVTPQVLPGSRSGPTPAFDETAELIDPAKQAEHFKPGVSKVVAQDASSVTYDNGDGTVTVEKHGRNINYQAPDGTWRRTDSTLTPAEDKRLKNKAGVIEASFSDATGNGSLVQVSRGDMQVSFDLEGAAKGKPAKLNANSVLFEEVLPNTDLTYRVEGERVKEEIVLKAKPTGEPVYRFPITTKGMKAVEKDGQITLQDGKGNVVFTVDSGAAWDAKTKSAEPVVKVSLTKDGNAFEISVDPAFLERSTYPVVIDPILDAGRNTGHWDASVSNANPTTTYNGSLQMEAGAYTDRAGYLSYPSQEFYSYLKFDMSPVAGKQIVNSQLKFWTYDKVNNVPLKIYPAESNWTDSTITWNNQPGHLNVTPISTTPALSAWSSIDVTQWSQYWANNDWGNFGFTMDTAGQNGYWRIAAMENYYQGLDPYVQITYNTKVTPGVITAPANNAVINTATPTLTATAGTDPDPYQTIQYWFRMSSTFDPDFGEQTNSGWLSSPSWTVPQGSLRDGVTYSWEMFTWDGYWMPKSAVWNFRVELGLGAPGTAAMDSYGPVSVNLASGNAFLQTSSPSFNTVGGSIGVSYSYNSQAQSEMGLTGSYWPGCVDFDTNNCPTDPYIVRRDKNIDFSWGAGSPDPSITNDQFRSQWTGFVTVPAAGSWCFQTIEDDGVKVKIGSSTLVDRWNDHSTTSPPWSGGSSDCTNFTTGNLTQPITVDHYDNGGGSHIQLWTVGPGAATQIVPPTWFSTSRGALPQGWQLSAGDGSDLSYTKATISNDVILLIDSSGDTYQFRRADINNPNSAWISPPEDNSLLTRMVENNETRYVVDSEDGLTYTFDSGGNLVRVRSSADDLSPASATYEYDSSGSFGRLKKITDPVSGKYIELKYSGDSGCGSAPSGFDSSAPAGMLCRVNYDQFLGSGIHTDLFYVGGQLARIADPGGQATDFSWNSSGFLANVRSPLAADWVTQGNPDDGRSRTVISYTGNKVQSVQLPQPSMAETNRQTHYYRYVSATETQFDDYGMSPPIGYAGKVTFDSAGRMLTSTDSAGITTEMTWNGDDQLVKSKNAGNGITSSSVYDGVGRPTDSYGPAASNCFNANGTLSGSCSGVPHSSTQYDQGLTGLAAKYWNNTSFSGPPIAHEHLSGSLSQNWGSGSPSGVNADNFAARYTGEIVLGATGLYGFTTSADDGVRVYIDGILVSSTWLGESPYSATFNNTATNSTHSIRVDYKEQTGTAAFNVQWITPTAGATTIPSSVLTPGFDLETTSTIHDSTAGAPSLVTATGYSRPEYGIPTATTQNPGGLALATSATFESPGSTGYLRKLSKTLPAGNTTTYSYYGNTQSVSDACLSGSVNQAGMMSTRTNPTPATGSAVVEHFVYDKAGRRAGSWINNEDHSCVTYNARGLVETQSFPAYGGSPGRTVTHNYAVAGNPLVTNISDPAGIITTTLDLLGRVKTYTDVWGKVTTYSYDQAGRITSTEGPNGAISNSYSSNGRLDVQSTGNTLGTTAATSVNYYDGGGNVRDVQYFTGSGWNGNDTWLSFARDASDRVRSVHLNRISTNTTIDSDVVTYSQSGRVVDQTINGTDANMSGNNFVYDAAGRLIDAYVPGRHTAYNFDFSWGCSVSGCNQNSGKNSNRQWTTAAYQYGRNYNYDNADRLIWTDDPGFTNPTYDSHGNMRTAGTGADYKDMSYDGANRHTATATPASTVTYVRDATDRIVERKVNGTTVARYAFCGAGDSPCATLDGNSVVQEQFIGLAGGASVTKRAGGDVWSYPNVHGDVMTVANSSGVKQGSTFISDPFGQSLNGTPDNAAGNMDYGWLGSKTRGTEHEGNLDIIEMGARQYSPSLGRFLSMDPIEGGSANDYDYVAGDPLNASDTDGHCKRMNNPSTEDYLNGKQCAPSGLGYQPGKSKRWFNTRMVDPFSDGCSTPGKNINGGPGYSFSRACATHDYCYDLLRYGAAGVSRSSCDRVLYFDLFSSCPIGRYSAACAGQATLYYEAVMANSAREKWRRPNGGIKTKW
jgi:RHS repeat-associated protein